MPKAYTCDLRKRVILAVELGTSRREAAEHFNISASSAVQWLQCWRDNGTASPKPRGGSVSRLGRYLKWILDLVAQQPDLTLDEVVEGMRKPRIPGSRTGVWRFLDPPDITGHKVAGVREGIEAVGAELRYLPKYSPDLNPIEMSFSKLKAFLRKISERTVEGLCRQIGSFIPSFSPQECLNYFRHAGYASI